MTQQSTQTQNGHGNFAVQIVRLPRLFIDDHIERGCDTPEIIKQSARFYWMRAEDPAMPELLNDAAHYASETMCGAGGWDESVMRFAYSAQRLICSFERQTGAVLDNQGRVRLVVK
jgi:hypothetical protein